MSCRACYWRTFFFLLVVLLLFFFFFCDGMAAKRAKTVPVKDVGVVVAATLQWGIGKNNTLPWKLKYVCVCVRVWL